MLRPPRISGEPRTRASTTGCCSPHGEWQATLAPRLAARCTTSTTITRWPFIQRGFWRRLRCSANLQPGALKYHRTFERRWRPPLSVGVDGMAFECGCWPPTALDTSDLKKTAGNRRFLVIGAFRRSGFQSDYVKGTVV